MKLASIVGARPQFIKAATVSREVRAGGDRREILIHTGQHYDDNMSEVFFRELGIPRPDYDLGVGSGAQGAQTGRMLERIEEVLIREAPQGVVVYGDTNSTLAGALSAAKLRIPVAHVEAGLRSFNRAMPEETNRVVADHVASLLFAPTAAAVQNLLREGVGQAGIHLVGDVMYDAAIHFAARAESESRVLQRMGLAPGSYVLATVHRAENADNERRLTAILGALQSLAADIPVVVPLHPRTRKALAGLGGSSATGLRLIDPVGYLDMTMLEKHARLVATDSGGVQKEAYFHGVRCVTLRAETEWVELVESGWNRLVPPESAAGVLRELREALDSPAPPQRPQLYGGGEAASRIVKVLSECWP